VLGSVQVIDISPPLWGRSDAEAAGWGLSRVLRIETLGEATGQAIRVAQRISGKTVSADSHQIDRSTTGSLYSSVLCGFELALWKLLNSVEVGDKLSPSHDLSPNHNADWWLPRERNKIEVCALLSGSAKESVSQAVIRFEQGFKTFKLKVGNPDVEQDISLIKDIDEVVGPESRIRIDANRAWSWKEAEYVLRSTADIELEYVEEPLGDPEGYRALVDAVPVPIALDESTHTVLTRELSSDDFSRDHVSKDGNLIRETPWLRALILKPMIRGGFRNSMRLARDAYRVGVEPVLSSSFESRTGLAGLVLFAGSLPGTGLAAGLDTLRYFKSESETLPAPVLNIDTIEHRPPASIETLKRLF
jgi:o-succinylbenzoate synthase